MSNKSMAKNFIDDTHASILDNMYTLAKAYTGNKKEAEKLVKNIIKIVVKINILYRNDQFSQEDLKVANQLREKFRTIVKTVISFFEVDFTFDKMFLIKNINDCRTLLKQLVGNHLTDKSLGRIDHVLDFFTEAAFLEEMFRTESPHRPTLQTIVDDMSKAFDEGGIWRRRVEMMCGVLVQEIFVHKMLNFVLGAGLGNVWGRWSSPIGS